MKSFDELRVPILSATFGAILTTLTVTPLDVVKVRLQSQLKDHPANFLSTTEAFIKIFKKEGFVSLYRGFLPSMAMSMPGTVVYFVGYEKFRDLLKEKGMVREWALPLLAGSVARVFAAVTVSPLELIRTRMQFSGREHGKFSVVAGALFKSVQKEGLRPLWRGLQPTLWRDVPFSAIYWFLLESSKKKLSTLLNFTEHQQEHAVENSLISFVCGVSSGAIAAAITTPFDVAKTRQQVLYSQSTLSTRTQPSRPQCPSSTWRQIMTIWREEGFKGLSSGMLPRVFKVAPACAIMIGSYELGKSIF